MDISAQTVFFDQRVADLADAAARGETEAMRRLMAAGADANAHGDRGVTPLLWALVHRNSEGATALLLAGADPAGADDDGTTAIHLAAIADDPALLRALLSGGASADIRDPKRGRTAIFDAILADRPAQFELLLPLTQLELADNFGSRPIHAAASVGDYPKLLRLLEGGANPGAADAAGLTFQAHLPRQGHLADAATPAFVSARRSLVAWLGEHRIALDAGLAKP